MLRKTLLFACLLSCVILVGGCQKEKTIGTDMVSGTVTLDGSPVEGASISFTPDGSGQSAYGVSAADGTYSLSILGGEAGKGTLAGDYIVTVSKIVEESTGKQEPDPNEPSQMREQKIAKDVLPLKYKNAKSSPLKVTVAPGGSTIDLALEK